MHLFQPQRYETRNQPQEKIWKDTNTWRLNNMLLNNEWVNQGIKEEIKKYMETNENENTTVQNVWYAAKAVLRGKFIAIQGYLKKQAKYQTNNLTLYLKELDKEEESPKPVQKAKVRAEINEIETKKMEQMNQELVL